MGIPLPLQLATPAFARRRSAYGCRDSTRKARTKESNATMNSTAKTDVATLPSSPKAQAAKEVIDANVKLLIEQLEAGHSEGLTAYLTAMGRFHTYSFLCCA